MRILALVTDAYGGNGGIALHNRNLCEALADHQDCEEVVVLPRVAYGDLGSIPPKVTFIRESTDGNAAYLRFVAGLLRERQQFELIVCGHINLLPIARLFTKHAILWTHGIEAWKRTWRAVSAGKDLRAVVSVSELTRQRFLAWSRYEGRTVVVPNAIKLEHYGIRPRDRDLESRYDVGGKRVLLTLGRIAARERYKGFDEVLEILPRLLIDHPDVVYLVCGGGDDLERLQRKATELRVTDHVRFTGFVSEEEKRGIYSLADVFVMPSHGEGFGLVLLEAMASGVPVIASKHDGGREAVRNGMLGRLVDPTNPHEIRVAILDALSDKERKIPDGLEEFSFRHFEARVHALIDDLRFE